MRRVGILGTFDVANFGDLLFPLIAQKRLGALTQCEVVALSPAGGDPIWGDCLPSRRLATANECDALLVGGGNVIRMSAATLDEYQIDAAAMAGYSMLWAGVADVAASGIPLCWNAPGVPEAFPQFQHSLVRVALDAATYLSVRDDDSRSLLLDVHPDANIDVILDTAWDIPILWSNVELDDAYRQVVQGRTDRTIAIHLNERYLGLPEAEVASCLDDIGVATDSTPLLLALGPCHGDDRLAMRVARKMVSSPIVIDHPSSLREIVACLSRSKAYLGSSMHGFITSMAFGVPALNVASQKVVKFAGLQRLLGSRTICVQTWSEARDWASSLDGAGNLPPEINTRLDAHWSRIADSVKSPQQRQIPAVEGLNEAILAATFQDLVGRFRKQQMRLKNLTKS
ncbi:polysaccharide pyruvyl transferase family protein [Aminobacter ciceronei]|nr:polysaccharide pyruvyl transferase family protein [Aminobacter ciceronei]